MYSSEAWRGKIPSIRFRVPWRRDVIHVGDSSALIGCVPDNVPAGDVYQERPKRGVLVVDTDSTSTENVSSNSANWMRDVIDGHTT